MKNKLLALLIATILTPVAAIANSEEYPAANFQPKVIFLDESVTSAASDADYPATNFQPKVLYVDAAAVSAESSKGEKSVFDPKYPAANFEPKIIYP